MTINVALFQKIRENKQNQPSDWHSGVFTLEAHPNKKVNSCIPTCRKLWVVLKADIKYRAL